MLMVMVIRLVVCVRSSDSYVTYAVMRSIFVDFKITITAKKAEDFKMLIYLIR